MRSYGLRNPAGALTEATYEILLSTSVPDDVPEGFAALEEGVIFCEGTSPLASVLGLAGDMSETTSRRIVGPDMPDSFVGVRATAI